MKKRCLLFSAFVTIGFVAASGRADIIYDVDFENPPHLIDQQVVTGAGTDRPQFADSTVIVRDSPADFTTQAASLEPAGAMTFAPGTTFTSGIALASWDMAITDLGTSGRAAVSLGSQSSLSIIMFFETDLSINMTLGGLNPVDVGSFTLAQQDSYSFNIDIDNALYDFSFNGTPVIEDASLPSGWDLINVSFGRDNLADPSYAVDNFQWQVIPEPSTVMLMLLGGLGLGLRQRVARNVTKLAVPGEVRSS